MIRHWRHCVPLLVVLCLAGCSAYQMGRPAAAIPTSVYLAPIANRSEVPQVRALLTDALRESFIRGGGWQVVAPDQATARVEVIVIALERRTAATSSEDTGRGFAFENRLRAEVTVLDPSGSLLLEPFIAEVSGVAYAEPSLPDSEYQELPALCRDLAQRIEGRLGAAW